MSLAQQPVIARSDPLTDMRSFIEKMWLTNAELCRSIFLDLFPQGERRSPTTKDQEDTFIMQFFSTNDFHTQGGRFLKQVLYSIALYNNQRIYDFAKEWCERNADLFADVDIKKQMGDCDSVRKFFDRQDAKKVDNDEQFLKRVMHLVQYWLKHRKIPSDGNASSMPSGSEQKLPVVKEEVEAPPAEGTPSDNQLPVDGITEKVPSLNVDSMPRQPIPRSTTTPVYGPLPEAHAPPMRFAPPQSLAMYNFKSMRPPMANLPHVDPHYRRDRHTSSDPPYVLGFNFASQLQYPSAPLHAYESGSTIRTRMKDSAPRGLVDPNSYQRMATEATPFSFRPPMHAHQPFHLAPMMDTRKPVRHSHQQIAKDGSAVGLPLERLPAEMRVDRHFIGTARTDVDTLFVPGLPHDVQHDAFFEAVRAVGLPLERLPAEMRVDRHFIGTARTDVDTLFVPGLPHDVQHDAFFEAVRAVVPGAYCKITIRKDAMGVVEPRRPAAHLLVKPIEAVRALITHNDGLLKLGDSEYRMEIARKHWTIYHEVDPHIERRASGSTSHERMSLQRVPTNPWDDESWTATGHVRSKAVLADDAPPSAPRSAPRSATSGHATSGHAASGHALSAHASSSHTTSGHATDIASYDDEHTSIKSVDEPAPSNGQVLQLGLKRIDRDKSTKAHLQATEAVDLSPAVILDESIANPALELPVDLQEPPPSSVPTERVILTREGPSAETMRNKSGVVAKAAETACLLHEGPSDQDQDKASFRPESDNADPVDADATPGRVVAKEAPPAAEAVNRTYGGSGVEGEIGTAKITSTTLAIDSNTTCAPSSAAASKDQPGESVALRPHVITHKEDGVSIKPNAGDTTAAVDARVASLKGGPRQTESLSPFARAATHSNKTSTKKGAKSKSKRKVTAVASRLATSKTEGNPDRVKLAEIFDKPSPKRTGKLSHKLQLKDSMFAKTYVPSPPSSPTKKMGFLQSTAARITNVFGGRANSTDAKDKRVPTDTPMMSDSSEMPTESDLGIEPVEASNLAVEAESDHAPSLAGLGLIGSGNILPQEGMERAPSGTASDASSTASSATLQYTPEASSNESGDKTPRLRLPTRVEASIVQAPVNKLVARKKKSTKMSQSPAKDKGNVEPALNRETDVLDLTRRGIDYDRDRTNTFDLSRLSEEPRNRSKLLHRAEQESESGEEKTTERLDPQNKDKSDDVSPFKKLENARSQFKLKEMEHEERKYRFHKNNDLDGMSKECIRWSQVTKVHATNIAKLESRLPYVILLQREE